MKTENQIELKPKKKYSKPVLTDYGKVKDMMGCPSGHPHHRHLPFCPGGRG